jgi:hypothetical protein
MGNWQTHNHRTYTRGHRPGAHHESATATSAVDRGFAIYADLLPTGNATCVAPNSHEEAPLRGTRASEFGYMYLSRAMSTRRHRDKTEQTTEACFRLESADMGVQQV